MSYWEDDEGRLHVGLQVKGRRIHRRLPPGSTKGDAKHLEAELRRALGKAKPVIPGNPMMHAVMALYVEHAKTLRSPKTATFHALRAGPWLENVRAEDAEHAMVKMVQDMREHYAAATINRSLGAVKAALKLAYDNRLTPENYGARIRRIPEHNQRHEYATVEQVAKLAEAASEQTKAAIWIALLTGCRRGELLKMKPDDVIGETLRIHAGNTKTLKVRTIPIVPALRPWLKYLPIELNFEGLKSGFRRAREKAGMPHLHFHDLRHSTASLLINMGVDLKVISMILGHSTVKTTERYAHLIIDRQRDALNLLSAAVPGVIPVQNAANP